jgi:large subunit ribosomal protein L15
MDLSNLKPAKGSVKNRKRIGRGQGSGHGGTSTRGHKGAGSRSGYSRKIGHEGGQMPLVRRLPKFGFNNINRREFTPINLAALQQLHELKGIKVFDPQILAENGLASKNDEIKILAKGELKASVSIKAHAFSAKAASIIESLGGTIEKI